MSYRVISLVKVPGTDPQEFQLFLKDSDNTHAGYLGHTEYGTEEVVREMLSLGGMDPDEVEIALRSAT